MQKLTCMKRTCLGLWYGARLIVQLAAACYLTISFTCFNLQAESRDLTALSLEELMNIRLRSSSVMGIHHTHPKGEWMFGYTQMRMHMAGQSQRDQQARRPGCFGALMVAPTSMDMEMHMFGVMYAPLEDLTFMAMLPAMRLSMDHATRRGTRFTTQSSGVGDVSVTGLYTFWKREESRFISTSAAASRQGPSTRGGIRRPGPTRGYPIRCNWGSARLPSSRESPTLRSPKGGIGAGTYRRACPWVATTTVTVSETVMCSTAGSPAAGTTGSAHLYGR